MSNGPQSNRLPHAGGVGQRAAEPAAGRLGRRGQEAVQLAGQRGIRGVQLLPAGLQALDPLIHGAAGEEPAREQRQLAAGHQDHVRAGPAQVLGAVGAVGEQRRQLVGGQLARERREPHLQPLGRGELAGGAEPPGVAAGDPHGGAAQLPGDDAHLAADDVGVEVLAAVVTARGEAGVVVDALAAHGGSPSGQDAAASASIIFWMGPAAAPPATMATPIEPSVMTVPSHTIVVTGRV